MKSYLIFLYAVASIAFAYAELYGEDYCSMSCNPDPRKAAIPHIGCGHTNKFAPSCQSNANTITMDASLQKLVLHMHNQKRDFIAGGGIQKFGRACRMATMSWDNHLAYLAELNVKQCLSQHDFCHSTKNYPYSGQNLYMYVQCPPKGYNNTEMFEIAFKSWYDEITLIQPNFIDKLPVFTGGNEWRHFTVMIREPNIRVGCAAALFVIRSNTAYGTCPPGESESYLIACNYATDNIYGLPLYTKCANSRENCKSKNINKAYPNLCPENEEYDVKDLTAK